MSGGYARDVVVLQVVVTLWHTWWAARSLRALARGDRRTIMFVQLVFYFFFAVPQLLDLVIGPPTYSAQRGFILSQFDHSTNVIYLLYLAVTPLIFALLGGRASAIADTSGTTLRLGQLARVIAWAAMVLLPFVLVLAPQPAQYLHYAAFIGHSIEGADQYHAFVVLIATLAAIAAVLVISAENSVTIARVTAGAFLLLSVWVHGKRSVVALTLLLILYLLWMRGVLRGWRFISAAVACGLALGVFSYAYQTNVREIGNDRPQRDQSRQASAFYVNYRIDYGRDAVAKQTIYAELNPEQVTILEYRGQSLLFDVAMLVPRRVWPGKPYPYPIYVTAAMFGIPPRDIGWGVTTSWLEESVANLGWIGILFGPAVPALICAVGDRQRSMLIGILTVSVGSFLLVLSLVAFFPLFALWLILVVRTPRSTTKSHA